MSLASVELVNKSVVSASSTNSNSNDCYGGNCDVVNVKQTTLNNEEDHLTDWQSSPSTACSSEWVTADWSKEGGYSLTSMSVLFAKKDTGSRAKKLSIKNTNGATVDVTEYVRCTPAKVQDGADLVLWDICALDVIAPTGTWDNIVSAKWTFDPIAPSSGGTCRVGIYEIQMHGVKSQAGLSIGAVIGIILGVLALIAIVAVCLIRQANLRKRAARWLNQPRGGWESLELWAADRTNHHE
ncbi:hypothetical protein HDU81_003024 [Chytriomyces hyalinus]|nr:hypothetical protein HDU81_003024 [Chytriomyces hyalinus]